MSDDSLALEPAPPTDELHNPAGHREVWADWRPVRTLRNAHVQTALAARGLRRPSVWRRSRTLRHNAESLVLQCRDGVRMHGLLTRHGDRARPLVTLIHGWEGHADSLYVISAGTALYNAGFDIFRLHLRDHGPTHALNREIFHACRLQEVIEAVDGIEQRVEPTQSFIAGFSMGGNFALRIAARSRDEGLALSAAVAISPVLEPRNTLEALEHSARFYQWYFVRKWKRSLAKKETCFPDLADWNTLRNLKTIRGLTDHLVREHTDFDSTDAYLDGYAVTGDCMKSNRIPTWLLMADDDPVNPAADLARVSGNDHLQVVRSHFGGHCGFIDDWHLNCWADRFLVQKFGGLL